MVKLIAIYKQPDDPAAFDKAYFETHVPLAKKMPGLIKAEVERCTGSAMPGSPHPYLIAYLCFKDQDALNAAMTSPEGKAAAKNLMSFAAKYVQMYFTEVVEV